MASSTTRRHSRDDPREEIAYVGRKTVAVFRVGVGVGVHVGAVECQLTGELYL